MPSPPAPAVYRRRRLVLVAGALLLCLAATAGIDHLVGDEDTSTASSRATGSTSVVPTSVQPLARPPVSSTTSTTMPTGRFLVAPGGGEVFGGGAGRVWRYRVEVEEGTGVAPEQFAATTDATLADPRGWTTADGIGLQRVTDDSADVVVTLATPATTDLLCHPLTTEGTQSCGIQGQAVINLTRWLEGAEPSRLGLDDYRHYLITHEVGHVIGHHGHDQCRGPGELATTMMQQTLGIGECAPNPWPVPGADRMG